jgi:hypothetical protein
MKRAICIIALGMLGTAPAAHAKMTIPQRADAIMREATARMTHGGIDEQGNRGFTQDPLPFDELIARYDRGERLYVRCGTQARIAQVMLARAGIRSRLVASLAASGPVRPDGHTWMEVWTGRRWIAYDPDGNRQPVDAKGRAIDAATELVSRPFRWRYIASDLYDDGYPKFRYRQLDKALDHALGVLAIQIDVTGEFAYHGTPANRARVEKYPFGWTPVGKKRWARIVAKGTGSEGPVW